MCFTAQAVAKNPPNPKCGEVLITGQSRFLLRDSDIGLSPLLGFLILWRLRGTVGK